MGPFEMPAMGDGAGGYGGGPTTTAGYGPAAPPPPPGTTASVMGASMVPSSIPNIHLPLCSLAQPQLSFHGKYGVGYGGICEQPAM